MKKRKKVQFGLAIIIGALVLSSELDQTSASFLSLGLILIFGVPHGALDHKIYFSTASLPNRWYFFFKYIGLILAYLLWWFLEPISAFLAFLILSAFHFGQEFLEEHQIANRSWLNFIWGSTIIIAPVLYNFEIVDPYIVALVDQDLPPVSYSSLQVVAGSLVLLSLLTLPYLKSKNNLNKRNLAEIICFLLLMIVLHTQLYFVVSFTIYFLFFHSTNAFVHQYKWLKAKNTTYNLKKFFLDLAAFSLLAIVGIVLLLLFIKPIDSVTITSYFFILVSVITLPHAAIFDHFYHVKSPADLS